MRSLFNAMDLEEKRRAILALLIQNKGELPGKALSSGQKRIASYMEHDDLCHWLPRTCGPTLKRDYQTLKLTKTGLAAFSKDADATERSGE
jgi:hypothetical protein